ncbi:hypothetical protein [Rhodococcus kronopolitis]|uniref:Uncharacterized protein n=1 Tax=Rhodococcus kronopolitis TaxID=1460226 RepID=A0ABV9FRM9_9NOCA
MTSPAAQTCETVDITTIERTATRLWRRAGVRRSDRIALLGELTGELDAAVADGVGTSGVVGDDPATTLREWADERELSGRAYRLGLVVPAVLLGATVGLGAILALLFLAFRSIATVEPGNILIVVYALSAALAYLCALAGTWGALRLGGDPHATSTALTLSWVLPLTGLAALAGGVGTAWIQGFSTTPTTFVTTVTAVCLVISAGAAAARHLALRGSPA